MSEFAGTARLGWAISARPAGEVLAARARGEEIELMLLTRAAGYDPAQIESWLAELIGVEVVFSQEGVDRRLLVEVQDGGGAVLVGDAESLARVGGAGGFEDIDTQQQVCLSVWN